MNDAVQPASGDAVSRKAMHQKVFERMSAEVPESRAHLGGYHTGKRDAYLNVIADLKDFESLPSIPSPAETGEGRYREAEQRVRNMYENWRKNQGQNDKFHLLTVLNVIEVVANIFGVSINGDLSLSPSGEQPGPSKSTMGLMTKEEDGE